MAFSMRCGASRFFSARGFCWVKVDWRTYRLAGLSSVSLIATKTVSFALAPADLLVLGVLLWRNRSRRVLVIAALRSAGLLMAAASPGWRCGRLEARRCLSSVRATFARRLPAGRVCELRLAVLLAQLPFLTGYPQLAEWPPRAYEFWVEKSWGAFGWLEVRWPKEVYWLLAAAGTRRGLGAVSRYGDGGLA